MRKHLLSLFAFALIGALSFGFAGAPALNLVPLQFSNKTPWKLKVTPLYTEAPKKNVISAEFAPGQTKKIPFESKIGEAKLKGFEVRWLDQSTWRVYTTTPLDNLSPGNWCYIAEKGANSPILVKTCK